MSRVVALPVRDGFWQGHLLTLFTVHDEIQVGRCLRLGADLSTLKTFADADFHEVASYRKAGDLALARWLLESCWLFADVDI